MNSDFSLSAARDLAGLLYSQASESRDARLALAYRRVWGRVATAEELALADEFIAARAAGIRASDRAAGDLPLPTNLPPDVDAPEAAAVTLFCLTLLNSNEFLYID